MSSNVSKTIMNGAGAEPAIHGSHQIQKVLPQTLIDFPLSQTSLTESIFYIPNTVYSMGESSLTFNLKMTAPAVGYNNLWKLGNVLIDSIALYNSAGVFIANIDSHGEFSRAVLPLKTDSTELHSKEHTLGALTKVLSKSGDRGGGVASSNFIASGTFTTGFSGTRIVAGAYASADRGYLEPQYINAVASGAGVDTYYNVQIPFSEFVHTIMADKVNSYWNDQLQLRIRWSPVQRIAYDNASATLNTLTTTLGSVAGSISDLAIQLAVEKNPDAVKLAVAKTSAGYSKLIPYVYSFQQSSAGTSSSQQIQLNRGFGLRLLNIVCASYNNVSSTGFSAFDLNNLPDGSGVSAKVTSFNTYLDSQQLQINSVVCSDNDDYTLMKSMLRDTVTGLSSNVFKYNKVWCDSWRSPDLSYAQYDDSIPDGIDLSINRTYSMNKTQVSATYRDFMFCIVQRKLTVGAGGVALE